MRILFVDDEVRVLESLRRMLHSQSHLWEMAFWNGRRRMGSISWTKAQDAVVMDVKMPGASGLELLARMQQAEQAKGVPVVMLTGLAEHDLKSRALELGAADLLAKPVDPAELVARLGGVLRLKCCQDELKPITRCWSRRSRSGPWSWPTRGWTSSGGWGKSPNNATNTPETTWSAWGSTAARSPKP